MRFTRTRRILGSISIVILLLLMVTSVVLADSHEQEEPPPPDTETGPIPPIEPPEVLAPGEGEEADLEGAMLQAVQAAPAAQINYQGFLTDVGGSPLDGQYDITFTLYDAPANGTAAWGPEVHVGVPVIDGLFHVALGTITPLEITDFGAQLYLEVKVGTTTLPRQMFRAVPYAMGLVTGARVHGATASESAYGLSVANSGGRGIYVDAKANGGYALYSADVIYSSEGYAGPTTTVWVPGTSLQPHSMNTSHAFNRHLEYGVTKIDLLSNNVHVGGLLPLQLERPYGRNYRLTHITLYYRVGNPSRINSVTVQGRNFNINDPLEIEVSDTDGTSPVYAPYNITIDPPFEINNEQTATNLWISIFGGLPNGQEGYVDIYGARLTLDSSY